MRKIKRGRGEEVKGGNFNLFLFIGNLSGLVEEGEFSVRCWKRAYNLFFWLLFGFLEFFVGIFFRKIGLIIEYLIIL